MSDGGQPIQLYEVGLFGELSRRPNPDDLAIVPTVTLEETIDRIEERVGRRLSPEEVSIERDRSAAVVLTRDDADRMKAARQRQLLVQSGEDPAGRAAAWGSA